MTAPVHSGSEETSLAARLRPLLEARRRRGETVTYQALAAEAAMEGPHRIHRLTLALEAMTRADVAAGRAPLAAFAVSKVGDGLPGRGFFELLAELGLYAGAPTGPEAAACHAALLERLLAADEGG